MASGPPPRRAPLVQMSNSRPADMFNRLRQRGSSDSGLGYCTPAPRVLASPTDDGFATDTTPLTTPIVDDVFEPEETAARGSAFVQGRRRSVRVEARARSRSFSNSPATVAAATALARSGSLSLRSNTPRTGSGKLQVNRLRRQNRRVSPLESPCNSRANTPAFFVSDDELSNMTTPGSASSTFDLRRGLDDLRLAQSGGDDDRRRSSSVTSLFGSGPARARAATVSMTEERRSHYGQQQQQHFFGPGYELRRTTLRPNGNGNSSGSFTACTTGAGSAMYGHPRYAASSATEACLSAAASMSASAPPSPTATQSSTSSGESGISLGDSGSSMNLSHAALSGVCGATACGTGGDALSTVSVSTAGAIASRGHSPHALSDSRPAPSQHTNREHPLVMPHPTNAARLSTGSFICAEDMAKVRAAAAYHSPPHRPRKQRDGDLAKCLFDKPDPQSPSQVGAGDGKGEQESELPQVNGFFDSEAYGEKDTFATPPPSEARRPRARVRQSAIGHLAQGGGVTLRRSRSSPISSSFSPAAAHSAAGSRGVSGAVACAKGPVSLTHGQFYSDAGWNTAASAAAAVPLEPMDEAEDEEDVAATAKQAMPMRSFTTADGAEVPVTPPPAHRTYGHYAGVGAPQPIAQGSPRLLEDSYAVRLDRLRYCALPTLDHAHFRDRRIRQIDADTLHELISSRDAFGRITRFYIIDCRFPFEYEGGHIAGARNLWTVELLIQFLFYNLELDLAAGDRTAFIFHCEFSAQRGPTQYLNVADMDTRITLSQNHNRLFPELYLLHGGYEQYFGKYPEDCTPQHYRTMDNADFKSELESSSNRLRVAEQWAKDKMWERHAIVNKLSDVVRQHGIRNVMAHHPVLQESQAMPTSPRTPHSQLSLAHAIAP